MRIAVIHTVTTLMDIIVPEDRTEEQELEHMRDTTDSEVNDMFMEFVDNPETDLVVTTSVIKVSD